MSWDGISLQKVHHGVRVHGWRDGQRPSSRVVIACGRRGARRWTAHADGVNCFACLKKMGVIK
jgi:hypothetical protein